MKTKLFFLLLLSLVVASQARISIPRPDAVSDVTNSSAASMKLPGSSAIPSFNSPAKAGKGQAAAYGQLPLSFEANQGQTDPQVQFLSRGSGYTLFLTKTEAVFQLRSRDSRDRALRKAATRLSIDDFRLPILDRRLSGIRPSSFSSPQSEIRTPQLPVVRMKLIGSNPNSEIEGLDQLPGISNYFIGNDPKKWRTNIPNYSRVQYRDVYPGISLVYYGNQRQLEYDLVVAPDADPRVIKLAYEGVDQMHVDRQGDLVLQVAGLELRQHKPRIYQETGEGKREVAGRYVLKGKQVAFEVGAYDLANDLVIDPVLVYSTFLGGSSLELANGIAVDASGNAYITGSTSSANFPVTTGSFQTINLGGFCGDLNGPCEHVFVSKFNTSGTALLYSTFLGGRLPAPNSLVGERGTGIAVDPWGNAYITGDTGSADFPAVNAIQAYNAGYHDAFVTKLNANGSALLYSTYLGGNDFDGASGIAVDGAGSAYVAAAGSSTNFPTSPVSHKIFGQGTGSYILKLSPTGSALVYSAVIGGSTPSAITVDNSQSLYITGMTKSMDFPTVNPFQAQVGDINDGDAFVSKLNPSGTELVYSSFMGGTGPDFGTGIAVDFLGNAYVTGSTASPDFPITPGAFQPAYEGFGENMRSNFVAKVNASGTNLAYSTYLLTKQAFWGYEGGVAVDSEGNAYVAGSTSSPDFPVIDALQPSYGGSPDPSDEFLNDFDAFVLKFDPQGSLLYSTFLGGSKAEHGHAIAVDKFGNAYVTGSTQSTDFPTYGPLQPVSGRSSTPPGDAFVAKISDNQGISLSLPSAAFNLEGGAGAVNVTVPDSYSWTAVSHASWITITSGSSGSGAGTVSFSATPTSLSAGPRTGTLTIAGRVFTVTQDPNDIFVPAVVSSSGMNNSFFTSELTLTNRGTEEATLQFTYTASSEFGGGGGTASDTLEAGHQRIVPDAIAYLRSLGITIPASGDHVGTLRIHVLGVPTSLVAATVRTTTAVARGRAGLAYAGIPASKALTGPVYLCGLRQNSTDRSNVALQNAGTSSDGDVVLQLTVFSGDPDTPFQQKLPAVRLAPGDFKQISGILRSNGLSLSNGYVRVERMSGTAPYYAYAVINDLVNSDGSFVSPQLQDEPVGNDPLILPAVVETSSFVSELILTNWSSETKSILFQYYAAGIETEFHYAQLQMDLKPGEQWIIPNFVGLLRQHGVPGVQKLDPTYAGILYVSPFVPLGHSEIVDPHGVCVGARTSSFGGGGRYGVFYSAVSRPRLFATPVWFYGLQQNAETRSNLALLDTTGPGSDPINGYKIELFDGDTGSKVNTLTGITLDSNHWIQINRILADSAPGVKQGYARVVPVLGSTPFIAYAVINDGSAAGQRTGDGAFIAGSP